MSGREISPSPPRQGFSHVLAYPSSVEIERYNKILMLVIMGEPMNASVQANGIHKFLRDKTEMKMGSFEAPQAGLKLINQETKVSF